MNTDETQHPLTALERHPLSRICGPMDGDTFMALVAGMVRNGFMPDHPIRMYQGQVLDGWHRYQAALMAHDINPDVAPVFTQFEGDDEAARTLVRTEHTRRDWTKSQRSMAEVALNEWRGKQEPGSYSSEPPKPRSKPRSEAEMADAAGVDVRTIRQAKAVYRAAVPEVVDAVIAGDLSVKAATGVVKLPEQEQRDAVATPQDKSHEKPSTPKVTRPKVPVVKPEVGASLEALEELKERNAILSEEHDRLVLRVGLDAGQYTEEERNSVEQIMADLKETITNLGYKLEAVTDSRDSLQNEVNELRKQCAIYRTQLQKRA
jgi:hypothetical protein